MKTLLVSFIRLGLFVIRHSSIPLMTITMLQLVSNSVKTITLTNIRMCQTVCITILFETKNILGSTTVSKARSIGLTFPHKNVVIVNFVHMKTQKQQERIPVSCVPPSLYRTRGVSVLEGTWDQRQRSPEGTWDQAVTQEMTSYRDPLPSVQNDRHV